MFLQNCKTTWCHNPKDHNWQQNIVPVKLLLQQQRKQNPNNCLTQNC
jgi:hypothetical protein